MKKSLIVFLTLISLNSFAQTAVNARIDKVVEGIYNFGIFQSNEGSDVICTFQDVQYRSIEIFEEMKFSNVESAIEYFEAVRKVLSGTDNIKQQYSMPNKTNGIRTSEIAFQILFEGNANTYITNEQVDEALSLLKAL
jgi:hypothetical protein|tara:strand:+ start:639 stop:1052 length:414 start_codon:yes stop_codon:yes gene_type:complete